MARRLLVLSGLPGVGKSTLARIIAGSTGAIPLRVDVIEATLRRRAVLTGPEGYEIAFDLAREYLRSGREVIADMVNADSWEREHWASVAADTGARLIAIEVRCSDEAEHRARVEGRSKEFPDQRLPDWASVQARGFAPWTVPHIVLDTASETPSRSAASLLRILDHA